MGQSKFEYGIGIGINHSKIEEDIKTQAGPGEESLKGIRLLNLYTRLGYKLNDNFHLNSGFGLSWMGGLRKDLTARVIGSTFEIPVQLEWNIGQNVSLASGPIYNYIFKLENETENTKFDQIHRTKSRHQFGLKHGIAFSYQLVELSLSYSHYLSDLYDLPLLDENGNKIGSVVSKFRNIQIGIVIRG